MCRLLGVTANRAVDLKFSLVLGPKPFKSFGREHPDGWGMGWYEADKPKLDKEALRADESKELPRLAAEAFSKIFICHVRQATCGEVSERNCHPFRFENWLFAHNGSVKNYSRLRERLKEQHQAAIQGNTDSEVYFHWILQSIEVTGDVVGGLRIALEEVDDYTALNFLLSDGESLFAFRQASANEHYYSLYYLQRDPEHPIPQTLRSKELAALIESKALRGEKAVLVCSEPLTDEEKWKDVPLGSLLVVDKRLRVWVKQIAILP